MCSVTRGSRLWFMTELCSDGDLNRYILKIQESKTAAENSLINAQICIQMLDGLKFLHHVSRRFRTKESPFLSEYSRSQRPQTGKYTCGFGGRAAPENQNRRFWPFHGDYRGELALFKRMWVRLLHGSRSLERTAEGISSMHRFSFSLLKNRI